MIKEHHVLGLMVNLLNRLNIRFKLTITLTLTLYSGLCRFILRGIVWSGLFSGL